MVTKTEHIGFSCTPDEKAIFIELYNRSGCKTMTDYFNSVNTERYMSMIQGKGVVAIDSNGKRSAHKTRNTLKKLQNMWKTNKL